MQSEAKRITKRGKNYGGSVGQAAGRLTERADMKERFVPKNDRNCK